MAPQVLRMNLLSFTQNLTVHGRPFEGSSVANKTNKQLSDTHKYNVKGGRQGHAGNSGEHGRSTLNHTGCNTEPRLFFLVDFHLR